MGANWRHTYQRSIYYLATSSNGSATAYVFRHDGRTLIFSEYNGSFYPQSDINDRLTGSAATGWTYTIGDTEEVETYDTDGRLLTIRNRTGLTHYLQYDQDGRLASVSDDFGHTLGFTYATTAGSLTAENQIASMVDPAGRVYQYGYNNGTSALTSVTYPDSTSRQYVYAGPTARALTSIVDENGATFATFAYNGFGEATLSTHAGNADKVSITYTKNGFTHWGPATIVDALGTSRTYQYTNVLGVARVTSVSQPAASG